MVCVHLCSGMLESMPDFQRQNQLHCAAQSLDLDLRNEESNQTLDIIMNKTIKHNEIANLEFTLAPYDFMWIKM